MPETEITEYVPALDEFGRPQNFGWARFPCFEYDPGLIINARRRISEGDRYILFSPTHLVVFEVLDDAYMGYINISVVSLKDKNRNTQTLITPFSMGRLGLPADSEKGSIKIVQKKNLINFADMGAGVKIIKVDIPKFWLQRSLKGTVVLTPPDDAQSMITHMPWRGKEDAFSYSRRSPCYFAEGVIQLSGQEIIFTRGNGWGIFDWNRRKRPRSDLSFWAGACGLAGKQQAGFSVGYSSADSSLGTENAFFLNGKLHKLDQVSFHIATERHVPWRFTSNDNRLEMIFSPHQERDDNHRMLFYSLKRRQLFGSFSGKVILDDGSEFEFQDLTGMAERRKSRF